MRRLLRIAIIALLPFGASAQRGPTPHIWFSPNDPHFREREFHLGPTDFMDLFQPEARWTSAASRVSVFKIGKDYVNAASDAELRTVISWLQQHRIELAMQGPMLTATAACGHNLEGYGPRATLAAAEKIQRLGGTIDILVIGESLWFGHFYSGPSACHSPIPELVAQQVHGARRIQQIFPRILVDDVEPITNFPDADWMKVIGEWIEEFRAQFGQPYRAVEIDIGWRRADWQQRACAISNYLRRIRVPVGMIYNGNPREQLGANWVLQAEQHWRAYEAVCGVPDDAIFQSWTPQPERNLPESSPEAFTSALIDYARYHR